MANLYGWQTALVWEIQALSGGHGDEHERLPAFVSLTERPVIPTNLSQWWYELCVWCPCCPCRERAGTGFAPEGVVMRMRAGQSLSGDPWVGRLPQTRYTHSNFVPTSYDRLCIGFSSDPSQDRSCRKFIITSLLVKLQPSHCLRISMACKCLGEGWWQWDSRWGVGGDIWKQSSVSSHRRSNFKHANNFQFHFSFFLLEGSSVAISEAWADNVIFMPPTSSFSRAGMGWRVSGCLPRLQPACCFMVLD